MLLMVRLYLVFASNYFMAWHVHGKTLPVESFCVTFCERFDNEL